MSHANLTVRFPDGTLRYGLYDGSWDRMLPGLFDADGQAWVFGGEVMDIGDPEEHEVRIACDYGGGGSWSGRATRERITSDLEARDDYENGLPGWWR